MIRKVAVTGLVAIASLVAPAATKPAAADPSARRRAVRHQARHARSAIVDLGQPLRGLERTVKKETNGACELDWAYSGSAGDEAGMIGAMKSKGLHGGALTATGLSSIYPSVVALQMPGLVETWPQLDTVRNKAKAHLRQGVRRRGLQDPRLGRRRHRPRHVPQGRQAGDPHARRASRRTTRSTSRATHIGSMFLATLGIQSPKALSVPAILPAIAGRNSDSVDVITTPAIAAEQLQWAPHVTHVVDMPIGFGIGALVMDTEFHKSIPDACKQVITDTGKNTSELLTQAIRGKDGEAWAELMKTEDGRDAHRPPRRPPGRRSSPRSGTS